MTAARSTTGACAGDPPAATGIELDPSPESITLSCPRPVRRPVMLQGWHDLASIHWRADPAAVQRLLPDDLVVDTCDGSAWVGLIPFRMHRVRVPGGPAFGGWSSFPETNVRTYVVAPDGRRAVWFCSLDITRLAPTLVARATYGLPYCWADMSITRRDADRWEYTAERRWPRPARRAGARVAVTVGERVPDDRLTEVERFVTARWALASSFLGRTLWADVDHPPWPVHRAHVDDCDESLLAAAGVPAPQGDPLVLWSPGVEVRIGRPRRLRSE